MILAFDNPTTLAANMVIVPPSELAIAPLQKELSSVTERLVRRPDTLETLVKKQLKTPNGPQRL